MISPTPASTVPTATEPSSKRGTITWSMTQWIATLEATVPRANTAAPSTAIGERPRVQAHHRREISPNPSRARWKR